MDVVTIQPPESGGSWRRDTGKRETTPTSEQVPLPVATFKNSLRLWQARWKAQHATRADEQAKRAPIGARQGGAPA